MRLSFALLNASVDCKEGPLEVLSQVVSDDRLSGLFTVASRIWIGPSNGWVDIVAARLLVLDKDLDDNAAALEEGEENEL